MKRLDNEQHTSVTAHVAAAAAAALLPESDEVDIGGFVASVRRA